MDSPSKFGASDQISCGACGGTMYVTRRSPHPVVTSYEQQTLTCLGCSNETRRTVNRDGEVLAV
jgi:hypothetical protein